MATNAIQLDDVSVKILEKTVNILIDKKERGKQIQEILDLLKTVEATDSIKVLQGKLDDLLVSKYNKESAPSKLIRNLRAKLKHKLKSPDSSTTKQMSKDEEHKAKELSKNITKNIEQVQNNIELQKSMPEEERKKNMRKSEMEVMVIINQIDNDLDEFLEAISSCNKATIESTINAFSIELDKILTKDKPQARGKKMEILDRLAQVEEEHELF